MASITFAVSDEDHPVPGIDAELADLFVMHAPAVQNWFAQQRQLHWDSVLVIADDEWVNPGDGTESLTVPAEAADLRVLEDVRSYAGRHAASYDLDAGAARFGAWLAEQTKEEDDG